MTHQEIRQKLKKLSGKGTAAEKAWLQKYLGSNKPTNSIKTADIVKLARLIITDNNWNGITLSKLLDSLYSKATTFEELHLAGCILGEGLKRKVAIDPNNLDYWLSFTYGWAETDVLCQSNFNSELLLSDWNTWKKLLIKFSKDKNIHKRRASLVLLTKSVRESSDTRLSDMAFTNIKLLKKEKEILITKAISWLLRSLITNHKNEVTEYLKNNKDSLPKIALRETLNKLTTGKK